MDAQRLGDFIAGRRRELGLTQAELARQLQVTDKAVSRWERGVGLPDINSFEPLAKALDVSLVELMQAKQSEDESISAHEAEKLVADAIRIPRPNTGARIVGSVVLMLFAMIILYLLTLAGEAFFSVGSIVTGLIAWGIPVWRLSFGRYNTGVIATVSFTCALAALVLQVMYIAGSANGGDWQSIEDTVNPLVLVCMMFSVITVFLNLIPSLITLDEEET